MYEALVKRLRELPPESFTFEIMGAMHEAADAIDKQNVIISGLNETIKMYENETPQWIPVEERLPVNTNPVLIVHRGGVSTGWYNGRYWERGANTNHRPIQTVTHWMQFPEPPTVSD